MTNVYFGNLNVEQVEKFLGIELSKEHKTFLEDSRTNNANFSKNKGLETANLWHCFDIPRVIHCGSKTFAMKLSEILQEYMQDGSFPNQVKIQISHETLEHEQFGYNERKRMIEEDLEVYVATRTYNNDEFDTSFSFYLLVRETEKGTLFLQELNYKLPKDLSRITIVPDLDSFKTTSSQIKKKRNAENVYKTKCLSTETTFVRWDGEPIAI